MLPRGVIKATPEDFVVDEIPLYEPSGAGEHLYVRFTKRGLTTDAAVRAIARALSVDPRDVGVAGLKDKVGVTTQTISLLTPRGVEPAAFDAKARELAIDGVTIHDARRHGNKLRTGHLAGNRFTLVVRDVDPASLDDAIAALERAGREGVPNYFGTQRFGAQGDNAERAKAWLTGGAPAPRDPRARRFLWSSLQSAVFNDVLRKRVDDGTWATPLEGDLLQKTDSGGLFLCTDVQADRPRAARGEVTPTGPLPGAKMRTPEGAPFALESAVIVHWLGEAFDFDRVRSLGEGARRALRLEVDDLRVERLDREFGSGVRVYFVLPRGAYATTVLASAFSLDDSAPGANEDDTPERT